MDEQKLHRFGEELGNLLRAYGIDVQRYTMQIFIEKDSYEQIKNRFTHVDHASSAVQVEEAEWIVRLMYRLPIGSLDTYNDSPSDT